MIYVGKVDKNGVVGNGYKQNSSAVATHVKVNGKNEFYSLGEIETVYQPTERYNGACFVRGKNGTMYPFSTETIRRAGTRVFIDRPQEILSGGFVIGVGEEVVELESVIYGVVDKSHIGEKQTICEVKNEGLFEVDNQMYSKTAFMSHNTAGNGEYVRATDGTYVKKVDLQIPAYKTANFPSGSEMTPLNGKFVVSSGKVILPDNTETSLPDDRVTFDGTDWYYNDDMGDGTGDGEPQKCTYVQERNVVDKFLIGGKIVDSSLIGVNGNKYMYDGEELAELKIHPIKVVTNAVSYKQTPTEINFLPTNTQKQDYTLSKQDGQLIYTFHNPATSREDGLERVETDNDRTYARFIYADKVVEYVLGDKEPVYKPNIHEDKTREIVHVASFAFEKLGTKKSDGIKFVYNPQLEQPFATSVKMDGDDITSFQLGEEKVDEVEWENGQLKAYSFRGCKVVIQRGKQDYQTSYIVTDETGKTHRLGNLKGSKFAHLYIDCKLAENLRDVEWTGGIITAFKLGEFEFSDIEWNDDATIDKCTLKHGDTIMREVGINHPKYGDLLRQLQVRVTTELKTQGFAPLLKTALLNKNGENASLNAEYVAGESKNGVADATKVESVNQALEQQKKYAENPYATHFVDENGTVREVEDIKSTYDAVTEFVNEDAKKMLEGMIGKSDVSYKNGKFEVKRGKDTQKTIDISMQVGITLISTVFLAPIGVAVMAIPAIASIGDRIKRRSIKHNVKRLNYDQLMGDMANNAEAKCKAEINKLVSETMKNIKHAKKEFSPSELPRIMDGIRADFEVKYNKIACTLEMLQKGEIESKFDLAKGGKVTAESLLGLLLCEKLHKEAVEGKFEHPDYAKCLKQTKADCLENFLLTSLSEEDKADYQSKSAKEKAEILKAFKQDVAKDKKQSKAFEQFSIKAQIEVMEKLGGRNGMHEAHKLKLDNVEMFLTDEQKAQYESADEKGKQEILKQRKKEIETEFTKGGAKWGNVDEQLEAFKLSDAYRMERSASKRRAMLKEKRKAIIDASTKKSVKSVEMQERLTATGENRATKMEQAVSAYREVCCAQMFTTGEIPANSPLFSGDGHTPKAFDYDFLDKMKDADKAMYVGRSLDELGSTIVASQNYTEGAQKQVQQHSEQLKQVKVLIEKNVQAIEATRETINSANGYIDALRTWANIAVASEKAVGENCDQAEGKLNEVPQGSAVPAEEQQVLIDANEQNRAEMAKCVADITEKRDNAKIGYNQEIEQQVNDAYVEMRRKEDEQYIADNQPQLKKFAVKYQERYGRQQEQDIQNAFLEMRDKKAYLLYKQNTVATYGELEDEVIMAMFWQSKERETEPKCAWIRRKFDATVVIQDDLIASENAESFDAYRKQVEQKAQQSGKPCPSEEKIKCMFAEWFKTQFDFEAFMNNPEIQQKFASKVVADLERIQAQQLETATQSTVSAEPVQQTEVSAVQETSATAEPEVEHDYDSEYEEGTGLTL